MPNWEIFMMYLGVIRVLRSKYVEKLGKGHSRRSRSREQEDERNEGTEVVKEREEEIRVD